MLGARGIHSTARAMLDVQGMDGRDDLQAVFVAYLGPVTPKRLKLNPVSCRP